MNTFFKSQWKILPQKMTGTDEIENSSNALKILNSKIIKEYNFKLPFSNEDRLIIEILKTKASDKKYPRKTGIPLKNLYKNIIFYFQHKINII